MYLKFFLILLLSANLYSSNITLDDVIDKEFKVDFRCCDANNSERLIKDFTETFASYLEGLHKNLPMQTLKEKEWVKKEMDRQNTAEWAKKRLREPGSSIYNTYDFKLYSTYRDLEFYIKELKGMSTDDGIAPIMYRLTLLMNEMRNLYVFESIQSFVKMKLMSSDALKGSDTDVYADSINIIIDRYFGWILRRYLSRVEYPQEWPSL